MLRRWQAVARVFGISARSAMCYPRAAHADVTGVDLAAQTRALMEVITSRDLTGVVLVAHSGGSFPAYETLDAVPERIARIVGEAVEHLRVGRRVERVRVSPSALGGLRLGARALGRIDHVEQGGAVPDRV
ncbi:hypothetical protein ACWCPW_51500, partial [Embleya sp. NPDC001921]